MSSLARSQSRYQGNQFDRRKARSVKICAAIFSLALADLVFAAPTGSVTATIYVGRHFEVRDHDQPTKYVFNGSTRVAEITGSLSSNLRVQRLRLYAGWDLCSLAVSGPFPASGAEAVSAAYQWNSGTADYSPVALGQTLGAGTVLWLKATTNAAVSVLGTYTDPTPQRVEAGGNYVSGAGLEAWSPALSNSTSSWEFGSGTAEWSDHLVGDLAAISDPPPILSPGEAFYLQAAAPVSLDIPDLTLRIRYYHEDHLGSSSVITDVTGALVEETAFYPFGHSRNEYELRQSHDPYQFTQKEHDLESGLVYFDARYLAPGLARFLSVDPLNRGDGHNAYNYAAENPVKYIDPAGLDPTLKAEGEVTHSGGLLEGPTSLELSGSFSEESTTTTSWILPTVKYNNRISMGGGLETDSTTAMGVLLGHSVGFKGYGQGQYSYSPDAVDPNWVLNVPFDVSFRGGVGLNGLSYSGTASARYQLGHIPLGKVSMSFHGNDLSVPEYSWRQYGFVGFYPKIDAGVLPVPPPEQAFNATQMQWGQGIGPTARYVRQWPTSRLELVAGLGVGLDEHNVPAFTGLFGRLTYSWGQQRSWGRMSDELSENAGVPK
jgi:RHS repeat-associated protein